MDKKEKSLSTTGIEIRRLLSKIKNKKSSISGQEMVDCLNSAVRRNSKNQPPPNS